MRHPLRAAIAVLGFTVAAALPFKVSAQAPAALTGLVSSPDEAAMEGVLVMDML